MNQRLFTPGPTPIPDEVSRAMSAPIIHHRQGPFKEVFRSASENLKYVFQTQEPVLILTSSGTGAMEAVVTNLLSSNDSAIYVNGGKFGERWGKILQKFGVNSVEVKVDWGKAVTPEALGDALKKLPRTKAVFLTHSETSTGTAIDLKAIADAIRSCSDALIIVDGISSVGALELRMDEWGLDAVITASQKALMLPPGLAFAALSKKAWESCHSSDLPKFYFDLEKARKALEKNQTPWTPAISLILGLHIALGMIRSEGLENVWARHERLARGLRRGAASLSLELFSSSPSNSLTALRMPDDVDGEELRKALREEHGIVVAGGQDHLRGKIIRIAHLGYFDEEDIISLVVALGAVLKEDSRGEEIDPDEAVRSVAEEFNRLRVRKSSISGE